MGGRDRGAPARQSALWSKTSFLGRCRSIRHFSRAEPPSSESPWRLCPAALRDVENQVAESLNSDQTSETERSAARLLQRRLPFSVDNAARLAQALQRIARDADRLVNEMDFRFLYNPKRKLFSTGYNVTAARLDPYALRSLASEARTAVFVAAAKGDVNQEAWFRLGRSFTSYLRRASASLLERNHV